MGAHDGSYDSRQHGGHHHNSKAQGDLNDGKYSDNSSQYEDVQNDLNDEDDDDQCEEDD